MDNTHKVVEGRKDALAGYDFKKGPDFINNKGAQNKIPHTIEDIIKKAIISVAKSDN